MPAIPLDTLRRAARSSRRPLAKALNESRRGGRTAFLCHSHLDTELVEGLVVLFDELKWDVYIDWKDTSLPESPDRETARAIQRRISAADLFLFLATPHSTGSRWCPWEIGYADGVKPLSTIFVIRTLDENGRYYGNEYLQLYRRIGISDIGNLASWRPGQYQKGILVKSL